MEKIAIFLRESFLGFVLSLHSVLDEMEEAEEELLVGRNGLGWNAGMISVISKQMVNCE